MRVDASSSRIAVLVVAAGAAACGALSSGADASTKYTALDVLVF